MILFVEHGLYPPKLPPKQGCHDRMCISDKGTYSRLRYNTNDGPDVSWRQYGGAGITLTADLRSYISDKGGDPNKLGKWTWMSIEGKAEESTIFVSTYCPCKNWVVYRVESASAILLKRA